jgi:hypothetical protein
MCDKQLDTFVTTIVVRYKSHPINTDAAGVASHNTTPPYQHGCDRCRERQYKAQGKVQEAE